METILRITQVLGEGGANLVAYPYGKGIGETICKLVSEYLKLEELMLQGTHGPFVFMASGLGFVDRLRPDINLDERRFFILWESPNSIFAEYYKKHKPSGVKPPVCGFFAGYSAGWWQAPTGLELDSREIRCAAEGNQRAGS